MAEHDLAELVPAAQTLERANIIVNKNLLPADRKEDWDYPGGLRIGTIEVTRFGMKEKDMEAIADMIKQRLDQDGIPCVLVPSNIVAVAGSGASFAVSGSSAGSPGPPPATP